MSPTPPPSDSRIEKWSAVSSPLRYVKAMPEPAVTSSNSGGPVEVGLAVGGVAGPTGADGLQPTAARPTSRPVRAASPRPDWAERRVDMWLARIRRRRVGADA